MCFSARYVISVAFVSERWGLCHVYSSFWVLLGLIYTASCMARLTSGYYNSYLSTYFSVKFNQVCKCKYSAICKVNVNITIIVTVIIIIIIIIFVTNAGEVSLLLLNSDDRKAYLIKPHILCASQKFHFALRRLNAVCIARFWIINQIKLLWKLLNNILLAHHSSLNSKSAANTLD